jgi:DNA-binding transcriptional regulator YiaG
LINKTELAQKAGLPITTIDLLENKEIVARDQKKILFGFGLELSEKHKTLERSGKIVSKNHRRVFMGKLESTIKSEIQRLAKREIRSTFIPLRREVRAMRLRLSSLSKNFSILDRLSKEQLQKVPKKGLEATPEEVKASRLTPDRIRRLRNKLGMSMRELGLLTRSSVGAVLSWEKGNFRPKGEKKVALVALRKLRKREVKKLLAEKALEPKEGLSKRKPGRKTRSKKLTRKGKPTARQNKPAAQKSGK